MSEAAEVARARVWKPFRDLAGRVSIRNKIMGMILALTLVLGLLMTWQVRDIMSRVLAGELESLGLAVATDLAGLVADDVEGGDVAALFTTLEATVANHPDLTYALVVSERGDVLAHTFADRGIPSDLQSVPETVLSESVQRAVYRLDGVRIYDFITPVEDVPGTFVRVGLTETRAERVVTSLTGQMLLTTAVLALAGVILAGGLTWFFTRPVLDLVRTTRSVGQGDLSVRAEYWADDEIGALVDAFNDMVGDLEAKETIIVENERVRTRLLEQIIGAQEEERKRIARELHDSVGQALSSMMLGATMLAREKLSEAGQRQASEMHRLGSETLQQVRELGRELRPRVLDDLGIAAALDRYTKEFSLRNPEIVVDLHCNVPHRLEPVVETALYRIVQEAMTNAARHSGGSTLSVLVTKSEAHVQVIVDDDGRGFDSARVRRNEHSVGIHGMAERAELVGGTLDIESGARGTTLYVAVPA